MKVLQLVNLRLACEPLFLTPLPHPLLQLRHIHDSELRIFLYTLDAYPDRSESDLGTREIVLEIEEIILGPIRWNVDGVSVVASIGCRLGIIDIL